MTFPSLYNVKAISKADSIIKMANQPRPPQSDWKEVSQMKRQKVFWTKELVQKYTWAFKSNVDMQPIYDQTSKEVKQIDNDIRETRFHMKNNYKNDFGLFKKLKGRIDELEEARAKVISAGQEQKFSLRHTAENIHNFIDLIGYNQ